MVRYIGDVHGKMNQYVEITSGCSESIQVGDFGAGFTTIPGLASSHRFIRGNHDNPEICRNHPRWIVDGHISDDHMFIGGAVSIDRNRRIEGVSWWRDEELSVGELYNMIDIYANAKPRVMVTHECPESIARQLFNSGKFEWTSATRQAFDTMLEIHQPEIWIFGHWHQDKDQKFGNTRFICLGELSYMDL